MEEYPRMMYHVAKEPAIVEGADEEARLLSEGWATGPVAFSDQAVLDAKIAETKALLGTLTRKRRDLLAQRGTDGPAQAVMPVPPAEAVAPALPLAGGEGGRETAPPPPKAGIRKKAAGKGGGGRSKKAGRSKSGRRAP